MNWRALALAGLGSATAAALGSRFTVPALRTEWYARLRKPSWQPPARAFGPAWTVLYGLMTLSAASLWSSPRRADSVARSKALFAGQLILNVTWSAAFFGRRSPRTGLTVISLLWAAIAAYMVSAWRVSKLASLLFLPYSLWVAFATALNAWIVANNPVRD